jgi:hypothetical protein
VLKVILGIALLYGSFRLAHYLRAITPSYNRPNWFRNPAAFAALNIAMVVLPILALWLVVAGAFSF